ncbi:MAG: YlxR family protein [Candidatus Eremiobacteraeota bacterium]|nr:YlxR family protein [Candidatus Eremiobacteraeota bacterium]
MGGAQTQSEHLSDKRGPQRAKRGGEYPVRTCVGCRQTHPQREMTRFVRTGQGWTRDQTAKARQPGRGAYLCSAACVKLVAKNRRFPGLASVAEEYGLISSSE